MNLNLFRIIVPVLAITISQLSNTAAAQDIEPGLYLRTTYAFGDLSLNTIYFGKGNRIVIDPTNGLDPFDFEAAERETPKTVGTWRLSGNNILVKWTESSKSKEESLSVEFEDGKLIAYDGGLVTKGESFEKNKKLSGTYAGSAQTKNASFSITLTLDEDGTFTLHKLGGVRGINGNNGRSESESTGTYTLSGNTLTLKSTEGKVTKHTVMPFSTAIDPDKATLEDEHLILDGKKLKREK